MAANACSARPPAVAYIFCYYLSLSPAIIMYKHPAIPRTGRVASITNVINHPVIKAKTIPETSVPIVMMSVDIF
jgi:hypothetical protein